MGTNQFVRSITTGLVASAWLAALPGTTVAPPEPVPASEAVLADSSPSGTIAALAASPGAVAVLALPAATGATAAAVGAAARWP